MKDKFQKGWNGFIKFIKKNKLVSFGVAFIVVVLIATLALASVVKEDGGLLKQKELKVSLSETECGFFKKMELKKAAKKIKLNYEVIEKTVGYDDNTGENIDGEIFKITLENVGTLFDVKIKNDYTQKEDNVEVKNNKAVYETRYTNDLIKYTVNIYVKNGDCKNELYRSFEFTTPVINNLYDTKECKENRNFKYCSKYLYESQISYDDLIKKLKVGE